MNKKILIVSILIALLLGGTAFSLITGNLRKKDNGIDGRATQVNYAQQVNGQETNEQMMARMHPEQALNNDMASHHAPVTTNAAGGTTSGDMADCPPSHHGGSASTVNTASVDNFNADLNPLTFASAVGQKAPDFTLTKRDGTSVKLSDFKGKAVILFFNEGSMCYPACWEQIVSLAQDKRLNNDEVVSLSIVVDSKSQWDKIIASQSKYGSATILFDTNRAVSKAYDVLNTQSSMHKGSYPGHSYFVIDKNGNVAFTYDDPNMAINNNLLAQKVPVATA